MRPIRGPFLFAPAFSRTCLLYLPNNLKHHSFLLDQLSGPPEGRLALEFIYNPGGFMTRLNALFRRVVREETGGEVLEYALIAGLIVVAAIAVIGTVGTKVLARWTSLDSSL